MVGTADSASPHTGKPGSVTPAASGQPSRRLVATGGLIVFLLGITILAAYVRFSQIWPEDVGLTWRPYEDEGVYALAGQLALQGAVPYRDFFFGHPPLAAYVFSPALLYHFNQWGSPTSFMMARYFSAALGVLSMLAIFGIGWKIEGWKAGAGAAGIWTIDAAVVESNRQVMLESPLTLLSLGAVLAGMMAAGRKNGDWWAVTAGILAALATLTKVPGALVIVIVVFGLLLARRWRPAVLALAAFSVLAGAIILPFQLLSQGELMSQAFLFQLMRPADGIAGRVERLASVIGNGESAATLVMAAAGLAVVIYGLRRSAGRRWLPVLVWLGLEILLMLAGRSYYAHYYVQMAASLALVGGAAVAAIRIPRWRAEHAVTAVGILALLASVPLAARQFGLLSEPHSDRIYVMVARYLNYTPPGSRVLTMDPQFSFLSAKEPARGPDGTYLVDSYGQLLYVALRAEAQDSDSRAPAAGESVGESRVWDAMRRPEPQDDLLSRVRLADYFVVDAKSAGRLTAETIEEIETQAQVLERHWRYVIYGVRGGS